MTQLTLEETHGSSVSSDTLLHEVASEAIESNITPKRALMNRVFKALRAEDIKIYLSGSSFTSASANPMHFALNKFLKVFYGLNKNLIIGSAYHEGIDVCYKYQLETGKVLRLGLAVRQLVKYVHKNISKLRDDEEMSEKDIIKMSIVYFKIYYKEQMPKNTPVESEVFLSMAAPEYLLKNPDNSEKIYLTGAADCIFKVDELLVMSDSKTSKNPISGNVDIDEKLLAYREEKIGLEIELIALEKQIHKFTNARVKLAEMQGTLDEVELKLSNAIANDKATTALEKRVIKWGAEVSKWQDHLKQLQQNTFMAREVSIKIEELDEVSKPLEEIYRDEKQQADIQAAKIAHGQQLAFYALLYMIITGKRIDRVRVENLVKSRRQPYLQVFEWDLEEFDLAQAEEEISINISLIEMALMGVDPMILFKANKTSYIGDDTNKFLQELENVVRLKKEEEFKLSA